MKAELCVSVSATAELLVNNGALLNLASHLRYYYRKVTLKLLLRLQLGTQ